MGQETEYLFDALFALEEIREILRNTAPHHKLDDKQKEVLKESIMRVRESLRGLEGLL